MFFLKVIKLSAAAHELITLPLISANSKLLSRISLNWSCSRETENSVISYDFFTFDGNGLVNFNLLLKKMTLTFDLW